MALLAALQLRTDRTDRNLRLGIDPTGPTPRHAFIVNSLKRPEEIKVLREIYGDAFVALGVYTDRDTRRAILAARIAISKNKESDQCRHIAERLITRDETEATTFGQDVSHTFFRADAFIDATTLQFADDAIRRFVEVLFGHPFQTPTPNELGMQYAFSAALRSADLSRQVGAAICTQDGQLVAVGTNEVPKAGGGLYWPENPDHRDFRFAGSDEPNAEMKRVILTDLLYRLRDEALLRDDVDLSDIAMESLAKRERIKESRLMNITEYGRAVHAEMAAITDAARRGVSVSGAKLFSTTFPCHNCAKHIVATGIREVIYIEPYPKSQVAKLFPDSISVDGKTCDGRVSFSSFVGFAPTRFADFFLMTDRRDADKHILKWENIRENAQPRVWSVPDAYLTAETNKTRKLLETMTATGLRYRKGGPR